MSDDIVTVMTFISTMEANIVYSMLRDHGVVCQLTNCNMSTLYTSVGINIELIARGEDVERINEILSGDSLFRQ